MRKLSAGKTLLCFAVGVAIGLILIQKDQIGFWLFGSPIAALAIFNGPVGGRRYLAMMRARLAEDPDARTSFYIQAVLSMWMIAVGAVLLLDAYGIERSDYGLTLSLGDDAEGLFVLIGAACGAIIGAVIARRRGTAGEQKTLQKIPEGVFLILPRSKRERRVWILVSLSAGIGEEIVYRGFLTTYFYYLSPEFPLWLALSLSTVAFGLAHVYQGRRGVLYTTILGAAIAYLYWLTDSLLLPMIVHTIVDLAVLFRRLPEGGVALQEINPSEQPT